MTVDEMEKQRCHCTDSNVMAAKAMPWIKTLAHWMQRVKMETHTGGSGPLSLAAIEAALQTFHGEFSCVP
jgi:hypothetical protein